MNNWKLLFEVYIVLLCSDDKLLRNLLCSASKITRGRLYEPKNRIFKSGTIWCIKNSAINIYFDLKKTNAAIIYYKIDFSVFRAWCIFNFLLFDDTIILFKKKHQVAKSMIHFMQVKLQLTYSNTLRLWQKDNFNCNLTTTTKRIP